MERYSAEFVILIVAENEDEFNNARIELVNIGVLLHSWEEDKEGALWKCIGSNSYWLETVKEVRDLAKEIRAIQGVLFEDSSVIIQSSEFSLPKLLNFKKSHLK